MSGKDKVDTVEDWMKQHSKKVLALIVVNFQKTLTRVLTEKVGLLEQVKALESDCRDLLTDLNLERIKNTPSIRVDQMIPPQDRYVFDDNSRKIKIPFGDVF